MGHFELGPSSCCLRSKKQKLHAATPPRPPRASAWHTSTPAPPDPPPYRWLKLSQHGSNRRQHRRSSPV